MKFQFPTITALLAATALFVSCSNDDDTPEAIEGTGDAELFFDNGIAGDALVLGGTYTNSNGESLTINRLNYIVSNVVLIKADGSEYAYPKAESYFVISEEDDMLTVHLEAVPAGDYKKVRFGIGVDQQRYNEGEAAQQDFWNLAVANDMGTLWANGYRFINFEGSFTSAAVTGQLPFAVYQGSPAGADNYKEVTLNLPTTAHVRHDIAPSIHIKTDINQLLDGANKIVLGNNLDAGNASATIASGNNLAKIAANTPAVFTVDHVHNESGEHDE
jgi:hypothetical protein